MAKKGPAVRRPRRSVIATSKERALDGQNPGRRRNYSVRDSQTYAEPTLFQMSGAFKINNERSSKRTSGFGTAGV